MLSKYQGNKNLVTEIIVEWKNLCFNVSCIPLDKCNVHDSVLKVILEMYHCINTLPSVKASICNLIPLSEKDMQQLCGRFNLPADNIYQIESTSSILVYCNDFLYKHNPSPTQQMTLLKLSIEESSEVVLTPESSIKCHKLTFYKFKMLPNLPLSRDQACKCLKKLIEGVYLALSELHNKYDLAHLDVRLENICFNDQS